MSGLEEHLMRVLDICIITSLALVNHHAVCHCIDVGCASLQQSNTNPYRLNPLKLEFMRQGLQYIFVNNIIKLTYNKWCFPCILVQQMTPFISYLVLDRLIPFENRIQTIFKELTIVVMRLGMHNMWENLIYWKTTYWQVLLTDRDRDIV